MTARELMHAAMSTCGVPVDELDLSWLPTLTSLNRDQCQLVAYLVAAAYGNGARDAGSDE